MNGNDKTYQMRNNDLVVGYENLPEGVLHFEVHCERAYLWEVEKKSGVTATDALLWLLIQESGERITSHFARCFSDARFAQTEELLRGVSGGEITVDYLKVKYK